MLTKSKAIVLNSLRYNDTKVFVSMFTSDYGSMTFSYSSSVRSKRPSMMQNILQPMNVVEVEFDYNPRRDITPLNGAQLAFPLRSIPFSPYKIAIGLFVSEVLRHALRAEQQNLQLFSFIVRSIEWLDMSEKDYANFHILLMLRLTLFLGILPGGDELTPQMESLLSHDYNTMAEVAFNRKERNSITAALLGYYQRHLPSFPDIKSFDVMQELFT